MQSAQLPCASSPSEETFPYRGRMFSKIHGFVKLNPDEAPSRSLRWVSGHQSTPCALPLNVLASATMSTQTREPQYRRCLEIQETNGLSQLGLITNQLWHDDPRHLLFLLARYKFVAKVLSGKKKVLEIGCADAFGTRVVLQEVESITAVEFDPVFIGDVESRMEDAWLFECKVHDMLHGPVAADFDAAYSLDVIEHIPQQHENRFIRNIADSLTDHGVL